MDNSRRSRKNTTLILVLLMMVSLSIQESEMESEMITRREIIMDMGSCLVTVGKLIPQVASLIGAFQIQVVPFVMMDVSSAVTTCQSFRYINTGQKCRILVLSLGDFIKYNWNFFMKKVHPSEVKAKLKFVLRRLNSIKNFCIVPK